MFAAHGVGAKVTEVTVGVGVLHVCVVESGKPPNEPWIVDVAPPPTKQVPNSGSVAGEVMETVDELEEVHAAVAVRFFLDPSE